MFLTGEFARIARVSKRQLQYYDTIGLFSPEHTDPQTGYRYYSAHQLPQLNRILALKDLGFTLEQVAEFIKEAISDKEIQVILARQKAELENRILDDLQRLRRIESRLQTPAHTVPDVVLKSIEAQRVVSTDHFCLHADDGLAFLTFLLAQTPQHVRRHDPERLLVVANDDDFNTEQVNLEFGFFVEDGTPATVPLTDGVVLSADAASSRGGNAGSCWRAAPYASHLRRARPMD